ncbi:MAG: Rieske 2Fe-2S domain-containing protein [Bacteroidota bacterium]|nr:Rieske 2Fe-2S domain-containing protein [Bacteroidota bacterium]
MERKLNRKDFIKFTCNAACSAGLAISMLNVEGCSPFPVIKTKHDKGMIKVPLLSVKENKDTIVRDLDLEYDIMIKKKDDTYIIFVLKCTHQDWLLSPNAKGFNCSLHGSTFDTEGKVVNGPASLPLKQLNYNIEQENLVITL